MKLFHLILLSNLLIASVVVSLPVGNSSTFASRIHLNDRQRFADEFGRERFFHGVNVVYKVNVLQIYISKYNMSLYL